jgi:hypothetical protein
VGVDELANRDVDDRLSNTGDISVLIHVELHFRLFNTTDGSKIFPVKQKRSLVYFKRKMELLEASMSIHDVLVETCKMRAFATEL